MEKYQIEFTAEELKLLRNALQCTIIAVEGHFVDSTSYRAILDRLPIVTVSIPPFEVPA